MYAVFFPFKKLRRNSKHLLFGAILLFGAVFVYHEMVAVQTWSSGPGLPLNADDSSWWRAMFVKTFKRDHRSDSEEHSAAWRSSYTPQAWKPEYKGQANLHAFDDWCGSSTADLRKNMHYPLHPHSRTTVKKLAVYPDWNNYGLRIFGYLHPYTDGEFVFAVSSDDNSEFWLSTDDSPLNLELLAWVGKTGTEWTVPGEFEKYTSQTSRPILLSAQRRYFFEVIHKQNDRGTDHVEVAWKLLDQGFRFMVIESNHISLYVNESGLLPSDVATIPQTAASHQHTPEQSHDTADMLREDPRDTFYRVPLINSKFLEGVLPDCSYNPSYTIKGLQLLRYQGLQFVHLSYVYPNDYTRLTHMETDRSCFYPEGPNHMKLYGFSRYMIPESREMRRKGLADLAGFHFQDRESLLDEEEDFGFHGRKSRLDDEEEFDNEADQREREIRPDQINNDLFPDYGDDYDDYVLKRKRQLFSIDTKETAAPKKTVNARQHVYQSQSARKPKQTNRGKLAGGKHRKAKTQQQISPKHFTSQQPHFTQTQSQNYSKPQHILNDLLIETPRTTKQLKFEKRATKLRTATSSPLTALNRHSPLVSLNQRDPEPRKHLREREIEMNMPLQLDLGDSVTTVNMITKGEMTKSWSDTKGDKVEARKEGQAKRRAVPEIEWSRTFQVSYQDFHALRSDTMDFECRLVGNLLLDSSDALPVVKAFMDQLDAKHPGQFELVRLINVVKHVDTAKGSRYLLELELKDVSGQLLRLSHYIYALTRSSRPHSSDFSFQPPKPQSVLCNPVGFRWNPAATVHFIVPVKNQARWVQQLITDIEQLFIDTQDTNFNLIITDYSSTDIDVKEALEKSSIPRYEYLKLSGNFERSAGLQAGIDLINDSHSIVFLCDLHITFPSSIIDSIRKHCVEGYMAFAPIVMRLDCGAAPSDARGTWEVQGFGLLGIYKSDLDAVGGMNTQEFTDKWGGEDWELLDRILEAGLEVERIYLRNFFHSFHSKRGMWNKQPS